MSQISSIPPPLFDIPSAEDPFRYGWRYVPVSLADGTQAVDMVPLTLDDVLHPQEGDVIPENTQQERDRRYFHNVLELCYADDPDTMTLSDCIIDWDVEGIRAHSPDITVLEKVLTKEGVWGIYRLAVDGGRPVLTAEIVSPHTRVNDVLTKKAEYYAVGVPLYVLVDQEKVGGPRRLIVYKHTPTGYEEVAPDPEGRVRLPGNVLIALEQDRLICFDAATGTELGDYTRVCHQLEDEIAARKVAEERADKAEDQARAEAEARALADAEAIAQAEARTRAEERAQKAEEQARAQAEARTRAEEQARAQAEARTRAEEQARTQAEACTRAEEQARAQAEARTRAEERAEKAEEQALQDRQRLETRLRELEDLLRGRPQGP